ncbi:MAG: 2-polyprenylphenol 6-hydroxylase [Thermodesulfobacteriota bacterium]
MGSHTVTNIRRLHKIATTLIRYGFGGLVGEIKLFPFLSVIERLFIFRGGRGRSVPERIRLVLEELGPTFIKLGQVASTRADVLPREWVEEFKKLQDMVPPFPFAEVKKTVERSLGAPLSDKFASFDETPIASASIAQVHKATLPDGTRVAVKVKRPHIEHTIDADISVMYTVARLLDRHVPAAKRYRPMDVVDEFARVIHNEIDLTVEGGNMSRFARMFEGDPLVHIPGIYWDRTTVEVLTMERISGTPMDEAEKIKALGLDIKEVAENGIRAFFRQVFEFGVFHADLHPGNIFVRDDGVLIYLDFGIVGRLDRTVRRYLASMLYYLVKEDYHRMAVVHREMGLIGRNVDIHEFEDALRDITAPIFGRSLEEINISALLMKLIQTARRFNMKLQPNLLLLQKSMVIIEGVGRQLYPDINMWEVAKPLIYKWMAREKLLSSPKAVVDRGRESGGELLEAVLDVPGQVHALFGAALRDDIKIGFVHHRLETLSDEVEGAGRRTFMGLVMAALILGSFMAATFSGIDASRVLGLPVISWVGFAVSVVLGVRLWAWSGWRD